MITGHRCWTPKIELCGSTVQVHFSPRGAAPLQSSLQSVDPHVAAAAAAAAARYNPQMQQQQVGSNPDSLEA